MDTREERSAGEKPYSPESYVAQYGVYLEDAREIVDSVKRGSSTHGEVKRIIQGMFAKDPELRERALMIEKPLSEEERKRAEDMLKKKKWDDIGKDLN